MSKKSEIMNMSEALDIEELERRLELATQAADCSCCGQHGSCNDKKSVTADETC